MDELEELLSDNRVWKERTVGIGLINAQQAWDWGCSGPILRASGIDWDLRKTQPYDAYAKMDFNVPVAGHGDCFDRYLVGVTICSYQNLAVCTYRMLGCGAREVLEQPMQSQQSSGEWPDEQGWPLCYMGCALAAACVFSQCSRVMAHG
jgi:hypothetical protein